MPNKTILSYQIVNFPQLKELLQSIDDEWAVCDDSDAHEHMTLVNPDRDQHPTLRPPPKSLFDELESGGLLAFDSSRSTAKGVPREYIEFLDEQVPEPFVYFYLLTDRAREYLQDG